jgi:hypothetical protein
MAIKARHHKSEKKAIDCDFSPGMVTGDTVATITFNAPAGITEFVSDRVVSGQLAQVRPDCHAAEVGKEYAIRITAMTTLGDIVHTYVDLTVLPD